MTSQEKDKPSFGAVFYSYKDYIQICPLFIYLLTYFLLVVTNHRRGSNYEN